MLGNARHIHETRAVRHEASAYLRARYIINEINRAYLDALIDTTEGYRLKDKALAGDITGATKELAMLKGRARQ